VTGRFYAPPRVIVVDVESGAATAGAPAQIQMRALWMVGGVDAGGAVGDAGGRAV